MLRGSLDVACGSVGVDIVIDPRDNPLLLGYSFFVTPSGRPVDVALRPDLTLELSSMLSPPTPKGISWASPQGESLGLNLSGIQLVPAECRP